MEETERLERKITGAGPDFPGGPLQVNTGSILGCGTKNPMCLSRLKKQKGKFNMKTKLLIVETAQILKRT